VQCLPARYQSTVTPLDCGIVWSPRWSPDGRTFYFARTWMPGLGVVYEGKSRALRPRYHVGPHGRPAGVNATSAIFGDPNLDFAYVTSMLRVVKRVRQREREAGGMFAVYGLGVRDIPEPRFRG